MKFSVISWFKYHSALITPLYIAIQYEDGETKKLHQERLCMFEHMEFLKDSAHDMKLLKCPTILLYYATVLLLLTKTGHLIAISHALVAKIEVKILKVIFT